MPFVQQTHKPSFIKLTDEQIEELKDFINRISRLGGNNRARMRGQAILFSHSGKTVVWIAQYLGFSERAIWKWRDAYEQKGIEGLKGIREFNG